MLINSSIGPKIIRGINIIAPTINTVINKKKLRFLLIFNLKWGQTIGIMRSIFNLDNQFIQSMESIAS